MVEDIETNHIKSKANSPGTYYNLSDYLIRVPGIQKVDGVYRIRDARSFNGEVEPLYVINGVPVGNNYDRANSLVDVNDIESVKVLKNVRDTNKYGMRGSTGVVEIVTKTQEK